MKYYLNLFLSNIINNIDVSGEEDIKDIKNIITYDLKYIYLLILSAVIISLLLFFILRKKKNNIPQEEKPDLPPEVSALDKINKLRGSKLIEQGRYKEFYTILSEIIRDYFEGKYKVSALDRTTFELVSELKKKNIINDKIGIIQKFLFDCDLVKFAKYIPLEGDPDKILNTAEKIITANAAENEQNGNPAEIKINV